MMRLRESINFAISPDMYKWKECIVFVDFLLHQVHEL